MALRAAVAANAHAMDLRAVLDDIRSEGPVSLLAIAAELNQRGMRTRRGGQWGEANVGNLLKRLRNRETYPLDRNSTNLDSQAPT